MTKIRLEAILEVIDSVTGGVDYTDRKGIKNTKRTIKSRHANPDVQARVKMMLPLMQNLWKQLPEPVRNAWNLQSKGKPLTGYNLFIMTNYEAVRDGGMLELSRGNGLAKPFNCEASINPSGEISVTFEKDSETAQVSIFIHNKVWKDAGRFIISKFDVAGKAMPVVMAGFDPSGDYNVYVVASNSVMAVSAIVSDSAGCAVRKK